MASYPSFSPDRQAGPRRIRRDRLARVHLNHPIRIQPQRKMPQRFSDSPADSSLAPARAVLPFKIKLRPVALAVKQFLPRHRRHIARLVRALRRDRVNHFPLAHQDHLRFMSAPLITFAHLSAMSAGFPAFTHVPPPPEHHPPARPATALASPPPPPPLRPSTTRRDGLIMTTTAPALILHGQLLLKKETTHRHSLCINAIEPAFLAAVKCRQSPPRFASASPFCELTSPPHATPHPRAPPNWFASRASVNSRSDIRFR